MFRKFKNPLSEIKGKNIILHWAPWCGPCRSFLSTFQDIEEEFKDFNFLKINAEEDRTLVDYLNIREIPSISVIINGKERKTFKVGGIDKEIILKEIKELK